MSIQIPEHLPNYDQFLEEIAILDLPFSGSEIHGVICGYLCAGAIEKGENYIRALAKNPTQKEKKKALMALFSIYAISQQQLLNFDFKFELLIPGEEQPLMNRAQAFSEWCDGFTRGMTMAGVSSAHLHEEDTAEAMQHISEFAKLDYDALQVEEEDERALMEVSEYTRLAILQIYNDIKNNSLNYTSENSH